MDFYLPGGASGCGRTSTTLCASAAQCLANARTANISVISRRKRWVSRIGRENRRVMWCSVTCENEVCVSLNPRKLQRGEPMIEVKYEHIVNHFMQRRSIICRDIGGESWEVSVCEYLQSINQFIFRTKDIMLSTIVRIYIQRFLQNLLARLRLVVLWPWSCYDLILELEFYYWVDHGGSEGFTHIMTITGKVTNCQEWIMKWHKINGQH